MSLGERIKERREQLNLSRKQLADAMGVTPSAVANYENGFSSPRADLVYSLIEVLKCDANYLYQDETAKLGGYFVKLYYQEHTYINKYRDLDPYGKELVKTVLDLECKRCREQKPSQAAPKPKLYLVRIAGRDGTYKEHWLTEDEANALDAKISDLESAADI